MIPVSTDTRLNSIGEKISIRSENNFWIFDIRLAFAVLAARVEQTPPMDTPPTPVAPPPRSDLAVEEVTA